MKKVTPCKIEINEYFDNTVTNDNNLPEVLMNRVNAVSYTHLDVYKRQTHTNIRFRSVLSKSRDSQTKGQDCAMNW